MTEPATGAGHPGAGDIPAGPPAGTAGPAGPNRVDPSAGELAPTDTGVGLDGGEVERRRALGFTNDVPSPTSRTYGDIARANLLTPFNLVLGTLLVAILAVGEERDALFGIVLVVNAAIGIVQESRSKQTLDRLTLLSAPQVRVRRAGVVAEVANGELVTGDVVLLGPGDQVTVDGTVVESAGLEIDESLLTGEADPEAKAPGDAVLSGSFVAAGSATVVATAVGRDAYAHRLGEEARRFTLVRSELRDGIDTIIKVATWVLVPTGGLLVLSQLRSGADVVGAVQGSVAGMVAMIPEGLVLLTSTALAISVIRLGRRNVLTQELAAIEGLARVDTLCVDKTGTLTEGHLVLSAVEPLPSAASEADGAADDAAARRALAALGASDPNPNPSLRAIVAGLAEATPPPWTATRAVPFSSARKWSAADFGDQGAFVLGAPDILLERVHADTAATVGARVGDHARTGRRVILLAAASGLPTADTLPDRLAPLALVVLEERLRSDAADTMAWFSRQGVRVLVISGDAPDTVAAVAARVGVPDADRSVDARTLPDDPDDPALAAALADNAVFGRVTPHQKRAMVHALQRNGHEVAMTGDGVNDTLALKDAEIGIAMGSGSPAARAVARFVLLDNSFAVFPSVVAEGRRVIANVERVANLFLTKTFYAMVLSLAVGVAGLPFPFLPRHLTLISSLTIGIPGFFLALAPNERRAETGFLPRVLRFAIPSGIVAGAATLTGYQVARTADQSLAQDRTTAVVVLFLVAFWVLGILARPFNTWRVGMLCGLGGAFFLSLALPMLRDYFELSLPSFPVLLWSVAVAGGACAVLEGTGRVAPRVESRWSTRRGGEAGPGQTQPVRTSANDSRI
jgi:cation-transporting ATPase E